MRTAQHASTVDADWATVTGSTPCPVCGAHRGGCRVHLEEGFARCARTPSDWPMTSGEWLHRTSSVLDPEAA